MFDVFYLLSLAFLQIFSIWAVKGNVPYLRNAHQNSTLAQICQGNSSNICFGVYVRPQWVLANMLCGHIYEKNVKILSGNKPTDCKTGNLDSIEKIWELKRSNGVVLIKTTGFYIEEDGLMEMGFVGDSGASRNCFAYYPKPNKKIKERSVILLPCSHAYDFEVDVGNQICLRSIKNKTVASYTDGSPIICDGKLIGIAISKNTEYGNVQILAGLAAFNDEIEDIINGDNVQAKNELLLKISNENVGVAVSRQKRAIEPKKIKKKTKKKNKRRSAKNKKGSKKKKNKKNKRGLTKIKKGLKKNKRGSKKSKKGSKKDKKRGSKKTNKKNKFYLSRMTEKTKRGFIGKIGAKIIDKIKSIFDKFIGKKGDKGGKDDKKDGKGNKDKKKDKKKGKKKKDKKDKRTKGDGDDDDDDEEVDEDGE